MIKKHLTGLNYYCYETLEEAKKDNKISFIYLGYGDIRGYIFTNKDLNKGYGDLKTCDICNTNKPLKKAILLKVINDDSILTGNYWVAICQDCLNGVIK